ncbi:MAG: DHH family phosphoesterase [Betaproteobacteria bacterium]
MTFYDIFNGDADGLCALQQLRLAQPQSSVLITGVKRDIALVQQVRAASGDSLTVLDISMHENRAAVLAQLDAGAQCIYFDHHFAGDIPLHPQLETHIHYAPGTCTSLIVDGYLCGAFRAWAVVGAYGDNLALQAGRLAVNLKLPAEALDNLRVLGECLNYNAYGDSLEDLHFNPAELFARLHRFADPQDFIRHDSVFDTLRTHYESDFARISDSRVLLDTASHYAIVLPDTAWARRVNGPWANRLVAQFPQRAHAVLVTRGNTYRVSIRAPAAHPVGADQLCAQFPSGGGRPAAAGINALPTDRLAALCAAFESAFASQP